MVNWDNEEDPIYANYYAFVSLDPFDDTRDATWLNRVFAILS